MLDFHTTRVTKEQLLAEVEGLRRNAPPSPKCSKAKKAMSRRGPASGVVLEILELEARSKLHHA
ncbi:MAG: hypothetical protein WCA91_00500, partial [Candidatus Acidiferrales bacterium]